LLASALAMRLSRCAPPSPRGRYHAAEEVDFTSPAGTQNRAWQERPRPAARSPVKEGSAARAP